MVGTKVEVGQRPVRRAASQAQVKVEEVGERRSGEEREEVVEERRDEHGEMEI